MSFLLWQQCLTRLQNELPATEFSMWIRPLQAELNNNILALYAPNRFVLDWVKYKYINNINKLLIFFCGSNIPKLKFEIGNKPKITHINSGFSTKLIIYPNLDNTCNKTTMVYYSNINSKHTFNNFIKGKSNQLACNAAIQVADNPGKIYNPLFIYGNTGLGKTHLLHAVGNNIIVSKVNTKVIYMHSERFVQDMVKALQNNAIESFKRYYRSIDVLLIDDIQFLAYKEHSQEEFFHTFNSLLEGKQQIILTSDRYPKEIHGVEDRLKSRFGWGLTIGIEPPELETRVAIIMKKADENKIEIQDEIAFFIAKHLKSNVRELEGALNRIKANANFTGKIITINFVKETLQDLLILQEKLVSIDSIQKTVAKYYKIKITDLLSKCRSRSVTRPRQMAMALIKELTNHSLPEIGNAFSGRDHTTVLHACRKIEQLKKNSYNIKKDFSYLIRTLSS